MEKKKSTKELARELGLLRRKSRSQGPSLSSIGKQPFQYIVVIDFESTCWKDQKFRSQEIIEFPAVLLNTLTGSCESEFHYYTQPCEDPVLSDFCKELTGISQAQVEDGIPLSFCMKKFNQWIDRLYREKQVLFNPAVNHPVKGTFLTWSDWDLGVCLQYECKRKQILKPSYLNSWIDIRATYRNFYGRKPNGLNGGLQDLGISFAGREHSGVDDARNTARLAWRMIQDGCLLNNTKTLKGPCTNPVGKAAHIAHTVNNIPPNKSVSCKVDQLHKLFKRPLSPNKNGSPSRKQSKGGDKLRDSFADKPSGFRALQDRTNIRLGNGQYRVKAHGLQGSPSGVRKTISANNEKSVSTRPKLLEKNNVEQYRDNGEVKTAGWSGTSGGSTLTSVNRCVNKPLPSTQKPGCGLTTMGTSTTTVIPNYRVNRITTLQSARNKIVPSATMTVYDGSIKTKPEAPSSSCPINHPFKSPVVSQENIGVSTRSEMSQSISIYNLSTNKMKDQKRTTLKSDNLSRQGLDKRQGRVQNCQKINGFITNSNKTTSSVTRMADAGTSLNELSTNPAKPISFTDRKQCTINMFARTPEVVSYLGWRHLRTTSCVSSTNSYLKASTCGITPPLCLCGKRSKRRIVQSPGPNQGRYFFSCPQGRRPDFFSNNKKVSCKFFKWESLISENSKFVPAPFRNAMSTGHLRKPISRVFRAQGETKTPYQNIPK